MNKSIPLLAALLALTLAACSSNAPAQGNTPTYTIPDGGVDYGPKVNPLSPTTG